MPLGRVLGWPTVAVRYTLKSVRLCFVSPQPSIPLKRPNDIWLRVVWIPLVILATNGLFLADSAFSFVAYAVWSVIGIGYALLIWELSMRWLLYVRRRYTGIQQTRRRVLITFAGYLIITSSLQALLIWLSDRTHTNSIPVTGAIYAKLIAAGFFGVLVMGSIFEFMYYVQKYREAVQESEAVKKAGLFLDELSSVYRYLLQAGQGPLVTLAKEVAFLAAYRYLLDTRFGSALHWKVTVNQSLMNRYLLPLTLQTLIENALRHNLLLPEQPLHIQIETGPDGRLLVRNNLQRKSTRVLSNQVGLATIATQYRLLGGGDMRVDDDDRFFTVRLPLLRRH